MRGGTIEQGPNKLMFMVCLNSWRPRGQYYSSGVPGVGAQSACWCTLYRVVRAKAADPSFLFFSCQSSSIDRNGKLASRNRLLGIDTAADEGYHVFF